MPTQKLPRSVTLASILTALAVSMVSELLVGEMGSWYPLKEGDVAVKIVVLDYATRKCLVFWVGTLCDPYTLCRTPRTIEQAIPGHPRL